MLLAEICKVDSEAGSCFFKFYQVLEFEFAEIEDIGVALPRLRKAHASVDNIEAWQS